MLQLEKLSDFTRYILDMEDFGLGNLVEWSFVGLIVGTSTKMFHKKMNELMNCKSKYI